MYMQSWWFFLQVCSWQKNKQHTVEKRFLICGSDFYPWRHIWIYLKCCRFRFGGTLPPFLLNLIFSSTYFHSITFIQYVHQSPFAEVPLHLNIAGQLSGKNLPGVPSWESSSGLPYRMPTHYHLSYAAPWRSYVALTLSFTHGWRKKGIIHRGWGAYLRCPVSTSVHFSLRYEGSTEYVCVRGEMYVDNVYRYQSVCLVGYNDFDFLKEKK